MPLHALNFQRPPTTHQAWRLLIACAFGLLTACGGGGGGATISNPNATAPTISLTRTGVTDPAEGIYSGNAALLTPSYKDPKFTYGAAQISWKDAAGATQTLQLTGSDTPVQVNPTQTTTYTLTVSYQDPSTIQPRQISTTASATVTIKPTETLLPSTLLSPSASTITLGSNVTLTPTFAWTGGTITKSVVNDGTNDIAVSSGTPIVVTPSQNTTYTLKLEYLDQRVIPAIAKTAQVSQAIIVNVGAGKIGLGGNLNTPRSNHIALLLPNNLVLVSGGVNNSVTLKSSELYDPVKNTWVATADMGTARTGHSAILLNNGKVLVTGGFDGTTALKTAEIYDPSSGTWTATTGPMTYSHNYHTSTPLADGKVLIAGGVLGPAINVDPKLTEVYDPILGTFAAGPSLPEPRQGHTSTVLQNGKVLFVGNSNGDSTAARIMTYTAPATFAWPDLATPAVPTGSLTYGRWNHSATLLASGKVLVAGGFGSNPKSAELYDPTTNTWAAAGTLSVGRALHTSTLLRNGKVLIIGGYNGITALSSIELYDPTLGWSNVTQKVLNTPRASHTSVLLSNDNVLVLGTYLPNGGLASNSTEIWAP
jgi:hypothetical protein